MPSLGTLTVYIKADIKELKTGLDIASKSIRNFTKNINDVTSKMPKQIFGDPKQAAAVATVIAKNAQKTVGPLGKVATAVKQVADGWKVGATSIKVSAKTMEGAIRDWWKRSIFSMLSLQKMMAKIIHYITFSIGVQMVMAIKRGFQTMISNFTDFERAAANAVTVSGYLGRSFNEVKKRVMDISKTLSKKTVFSAVEVAQAFYNLASAGIDIGKVTEKELAPILNYAAATQSSLEDATYAVLTAMKAFNLGMEDTARIVDVFTAAITNSFFTMQKMQEFMKYAAPIAGSLGVSLEETTAAGMSLVNMGLAGSQAGQRLNMVLTKLLKPTDKAEEMLADLGLTVESLDPSIYSLTEILWKLKAAGFGAAEAATMFRARTAASATVLVNSVTDIERYNSMLLMSKGITEDVAQAQTETLWGSFQLMRNAMQTAAIEIGESLLPYLHSFADFVKNKVGPALAAFFSSFIKALPGYLKYLTVFLQIIVAIKVFFKVLGIARKAVLAYGAAKAYLASVTASSAASSAASVAAIESETAAATAGTPAVLTYATAISVATGGLAALGAIAALGSLGIWNLTDTLANFNPTIEETNKRLEDLRGSIIAMYDQIKNAGELLIWASERGFGSIAEMWESLRGGKTLGEILDVKSLRMNISDATTQIAELSPTEVIFSAWIKQIDPAKQELAKSISSSIEDVMDLTAKISASKSTSILMGDWKARSEKLAREIKAEDVAKKFGMSTSEMFKSVFETLGVETTAGVTNWYKEFLSKMDELLKAGLATLLGTTTEEIKKRFDDLRFAINISTELYILQEALEDLEVSAREYEKAQSALNKVLKDSRSTLDEIAAAEERFRKAVEYREESIRNLMEAIGAVMTTSRSYSDVTNEGINSLENYLKVTRDLESAKDDLNEALESERQAQEALAEALATYGSNTEQVINAENRLYKAAKRRAELELDVSNLERQAKAAEEAWKYEKEHGIMVEKTNSELLKMGYTQEEINEMIKDYSEEAQKAFTAENATMSLKVLLPLSETEGEILSLTEEIAIAREHLGKVTADQSILEAELNGLMMVKERYTKLTTEKMKLYLEQQLKILDAELKLYKLRKGETKQLRDLFEKMTEQGLISDSLIDTYTGMEEAQGEVLSMTPEFMQVFSDLSDSQRELVEQFLNGEMSVDDFASAMQTSADLTKDGNKITSEQIEIIIAFQRALSNLNSSTEDFHDLLGPLIDDLMDAGVISPEVAAAWQEIADNGLEAAKATTEMLIAQGKIDETMQGLVKNAVRLFKALEDQNVMIETGRSSAEDLFDVYRSGEYAGKTIMEVMLEQMGLWDELGGNIQSVTSILEHFYGKSLREMTDAEIITAFAMIQAAQAAGCLLYTSPSPRD